jgi:hypothetical protein
VPAIHQPRRLNKTAVWRWWLQVHAQEGAATATQLALLPPSTVAPEFAYDLGARCKVL